MKLSQLIEELQTIYNEQGEMEVLVKNRKFGGGSIKTDAIFRFERGATGKYSFRVWDTDLGEELTVTRILNKVLLV